MLTQTYATPNRKNPPQTQPFNDFQLAKPISYTLNNGLHVWLLHAGTQPIVNIQLLFDAGKWHEPKQGLAAFLGKMIPEGTKKHDSNQIHEFFDSLGIFWDIVTGVDQTQMSFYGMVKHYEKLLLMIRELLTEATYPERELEQFKKDMIHQIRINKQKTNQEAGFLSRECLFGQHHPYGYQLTESLVESVTSQELLSFYQTHIQASPFHIILAGDVTEEHIILLNQILGSLPIASVVQAPICHIKQSEHPAKRYVEKENAIQTSIRLVRPLFVKRNPNQIAFDVLNETLGGYFGSRLMKNLREKNGFTYGVYSAIISMRHEGFISIGTDVNKEHRNAALTQIKYEIERLCHEPIPAEELALVKNYMSGSYLKSVNTPIAIADLYKNISYHGLPQDYFDHYISHINAVTSEQLLALAQTYLSGEFTEILVG